MSIKALYEIKRQTFLQGYIANPDRFDDALAFAHMHRLAPIFHEVSVREEHGEDPFAEAYWIDAEFAGSVTSHLDKLWKAENYEDMAFYKLEDKFGGYHNKRMELVFVLEYTRISGRFNDKTFEAIEADAPSEANNLDSTFSPEEVYFD
ncbi:MAG: hypothetical protein ACU0CC_14675 [Sagittula sp.]|uniref:hypothetical protein n=1 Tax=Sagittula sp. TaxID=2038081 RepID=UPI0040591638